MGCLTFRLCLRTSNHERCNAMKRFLLSRHQARRLAVFRRPVLLPASLALLAATCALAQDWPQWRGPNRDAKAPEFKAPKTWPKELTQKWKVTVGEGVATPALAGDRLLIRSAARIYCIRGKP